MKQFLQLSAALPADADAALLIGRVHVAGTGAMLVQVRADGVYDLSQLAPTCSELLELPDLAAAVRGNRGARIGATQDLLDNSAFDARHPSKPWFLAPCDLQAVKDAGVTFVASMLERVIEERVARPGGAAGGGRRDRRQPGRGATRLGVGGAAQGRAGGAGHVVAIPGSGHRSGCGNLHQVAAHERGGDRGRNWHPSRQHLEQSR